MARIAVVLLGLGIVFGAYWVVLPIARAWMLPEAGGDLLWVVGPAQALRFGACTVLSALTLPFVLRPLGRRWREADAAAGVKRETVQSQMPVLIRGGILFVIYAVCGAFYFVSYAEVRERTITFHSLLGTRDYGYERAVTLSHFPPEGGQVDRYGIAFDDERWGYFDASCEGLTPADVEAIAAHVAARTGLSWTPGVR